MQFFKTISGEHYPVSSVTRIGQGRKVTFQPAEREGVVHSIYLGDDIVEVTASEMRQIIDAPAHVIPAAPGTALVRYEDGADLPVWKTEVIGWAVASDGSVTPITPDGLNDGLSEPGAILMAGGGVVEPYSAAWRHLDDWKAEMEGRSKTS